MELSEFMNLKMNWVGRDETYHCYFFCLSDSSLVTHIYYLVSFTYVAEYTEAFAISASEEGSSW